MFFVGAVVATADGGAARGKDFSLLFVFAIARVLVLDGCDRSGCSRYSTTPMPMVSVCIEPPRVIVPFLYNESRRVEEKHEATLLSSLTTYVVNSNESY